MSTGPIKCGAGSINLFLVLLAGESLFFLSQGRQKMEQMQNAGRTAARYRQIMP